MLYRRVLMHGHVDEQLCTRSGRPIPINENTIVFFRAHVSNDGYGGSVLRGNIANGFKTVEIDSGFAAEVETQLPLPEGCAF